MVKNLPANTGDIRDMGSIPGLWRFPGGGHGNPRQYSYLENPMDRGTLWAKVHRVTKSWTRLKRFRTRLKRFSTRTLNRYQTPWGNMTYNSESPQMDLEFLYFYRKLHTDGSDVSLSLKTTGKSLKTLISTQLRNNDIYPKCSSVQLSTLKFMKKT